MIERTFIEEKIKEQMIREYLIEKFRNALVGDIKFMKTPLGDRIIIECARPGVIIGRKGVNLRKIAEELKEKYGLENPTIDVREIENPMLNPLVVAQRIALRLARMGPKRFRRIAHMTMNEVMAAGAQGVEIVLAGKLPGERAHKWKFKKGYVPKCGHIATHYVRFARIHVTLPPGDYGIKVWIFPPGVKKPDEIEIKDIPIEELKKRLEEKGIKVEWDESFGAEKNEQGGAEEKTE